MKPSAKRKVASSGGRAELSRPVGAAGGPAKSRWQHGRQCHFAVDGLLKNALNSRSDFRSILIDDPALLARLNHSTRAREGKVAHTLPWRKISLHGWRDVIYNFGEHQE